MMTRRWDLFCRVVDNYGDIGTCWRLARQLATEHQAQVRLWVDDLNSFARLCPTLVPDVPSQWLESLEIRHWTPSLPPVDAADVVIEAFACDLPAVYLEAMRNRPTPPLWINLEYLSAEDWVEDCHLLSSPQSTSSLQKYFFFPGFTSRTGGLLRERDLLRTRMQFDDAAAAGFWRGLQLAPPDAEERRISLFCYENAELPKLLTLWSQSPTPITLLATPGAAFEQVSRWSERPLTIETSWTRGALTMHPLPFLSQSDYDRLLWACDVNFVRGEDSFVRAQWAQQPFLWQIYPQTDDIHFRKLDAFLERYLADFSNAEAVRRCWSAWNGRGEIIPAWGDFLTRLGRIQHHNRQWAFRLDQVTDLANNLSYFVNTKLGD